MLFRNIARAFIKHVGNAVGFGVVGDIAIDVWDGWSKEGKDQPEKLAEVQQLAQQSAAETRELASTITLEVAGDQPEEVRQRLQTYLTQVPAMVRQSLRRPADPTGKTVPPGLAMTKPEDLLTFLPAKPSRFKIGDTPLPGVDWELVELLGVGGFGEVWKARNQFFDGVAPVALKFCLDSEASRTLRHEAAVLNQVMRQGKHAGIVQLQHSYLSANPPCLEYEYVQGGDLTGLIHDWHRSGSFSAETVTAVMLQLAEIVGFAHRLDPPIVHRDLKPANILLQQSQGGAVQLKVADFGIGGVAAGQAIKESAKGLPAGMMMTAVATGTYTPLYASPQQTSGRLADPRDDVYALGIIWYQMLTGDLNAGRPGGARWKQKATERGMKPELVDLLECCFEEDPNDRPRDAADLAERLKLLVAPAAAPGTATTRRNNKEGGDEGTEGGGSYDEKYWEDNYPGPLRCALWYRTLLTRCYGKVVTKFGKGYITLYLNDSVRVGVSPRKKPRANLIIHFLEGNFPEVTAHLTRVEIPFVSRDNKTVIFNTDLQELEERQPIHEWLVEHLLGSSRPADSSDIDVGQTSNGGGAEDAGEKLKPFWEGLLSRPKLKATRHAKINAREAPGIGIGVGVPGLSLNYVLGQEKGRVELNITRGTGKGEENKRIFDRLREHKVEIDAAFGIDLSWQRLDQKQSSRIEYITQGGYRSEESKWPEIQDAMIDAMIRLDHAVTPFLEKLKAELT